MGVWQEVLQVGSCTQGGCICGRQHGLPSPWTCFCPSPQNYVSCHDPDNNAPLMWPDVPYQILGGPTANKVIFEQRNGIYIFYISIVDPYYR